ncbi:hypothetical protein [Tritonibacter mobilis]|uniref:hypothetical protein n=1 Tax=Tritonibacter mobilis TaxID=379347 RepID=UPI0039A5E41F
MRTFIALLAFAVIAACAEDRSREVQVQVDGNTFNVYPDRTETNKWHAWPANRTFGYKPPPMVRLLNVKAIEAVSGCPALRETIHHLDGIFTSASVSC